MEKTLRKTIVYSETLIQDGTSVATLRGTVDTAKIGQYSVNCVILDKAMYEKYQDDVQAEEDEFTETLRAEANSGEDKTVTSEAETVEETAETKTTAAKAKTATKSKK